jgi:hypothetical protein
MSNIESQVQSAIAAERRENRKRDTKKALFVTFVVIPFVVIAAGAGWLLLGRIMDMLAT